MEELRSYMSDIGEFIRVISEVSNRASSRRC